MKYYDSINQSVKVVQETDVTADENAPLVSDNKDKVVFFYSKYFTSLYSSSLCSQKTQIVLMNHHMMKIFKWYVYPFICFSI